MKIPKIVILTATYNHPRELEALFASLEKQTERGFVWLVVDDGSARETGEALKRFQETAAFEMLVVSQTNAGKSSAVNQGLSHLPEGTDFVLIVDDDERLKEDAVSTVRAYCEKYRDTDCGVIHFHRMDERGEIIASPVIGEDYFMSYQRFKSLGRRADGYIGYFTDKLRAQRFTIYEGEKYIGPSTLYMKVTRDWKLLFAQASLGTTEYLAGGITKQGRRLRVRNPQGMAEYCMLMQENGASLKIRFLYSVHGWAYVRLAQKKGVRSAEKFMAAALLPGLLLAALWERKYRN